jgi:hypothetical protein
LCKIVPRLFFYTPSAGRTCRYEFCWMYIKKRNNQRYDLLAHLFALLYIAFVKYHWIGRLKSNLVTWLTAIMYTDCMMAYFSCWSMSAYFVAWYFQDIDRLTSVHPSGKYVTLAIEPRFRVCDILFKAQHLNRENETV